MSKDVVTSKSHQHGVSSRFGSELAMPENMFSCFPLHRFRKLMFQGSKETPNLYLAHLALASLLPPARIDRLPNLRQ